MKTLNTLFPTRLARRALLAAGLAGAAALVAPMAAQAQEQRRVAIVSALGDSITVVQSEPTTGSHFKDRRVEDVFPVPEGIFDVYALGQLQQGLAGANALLIPLKLKSASVLGDTDKLVDGGRWVGSDMLNQALKELKATHLVLLRPLRAPARVQMAQNTMGQGQLRGLGFYLDRNTFVRAESEAIAARRGFLAPYVYAELSVIDVAQGAVTGSAPIRFAESMTTNSVDGAGDAWDLLTTKQKIETLQESIRDEVAKQLPKVAAGLGATGANRATADAGGETATRVRP
ncbi:hypothetical protein [Roseateles sp.]|uniref:hypothetical protein n=1 Tax=Roseateles sp. TaxID=1971397 RepID=UPI0031D84933